MNAKNPSYYSFKRKIRMITRHHQKIHKKTPIIVNNMSLPKSKQKKLWNLWPIIQDIYPVLFILFSISTEFFELKFIRKTMLPKKKRFGFYRFNRTVKHQQKQCKKLPSKFVRTKPVLSQWMADVLEIRALHMFLSQAHTLSSHIHPNQILNHFLNDRIDVESVFIVELSWRKENIRRRYFLIWHLVLKKYEKNTDVEDKVACNQRTYSFFFFVIHGSISVEMKTMFFEYFSHISLLRHVFKTCQNWICEHFLSIVVHVHLFTLCLLENQIFSSIM